MKFEDEVKKYDFDFPPELVAQSPAHPRDSARLLVYERKTGAVAEDIFRNLPLYLPPRALLVLNETKVIPARLPLRRATGGLVKLLYLSRTGREARALAEKNLHSGEKLFHGKKPVFEVRGKSGKEYILYSLMPARELDRLFEQYGEAPIPPYIKHSPLKGARLREEYQTVFARRRGSVAAPTASLHFTKALLSKLKKKGIGTAFVTLHVGLGTFAPLMPENLAAGRLHKETYEIPAETAAALNRARREKRPVIAVGTTVMRTLESWAKTGKRRGETSLFIRPGYAFRKVDGLITNFHVPRSSLLMLAAAFAGRQNILRLYRQAVRREYRLFSFGDGMLIL